MKVTYTKIKNIQRLGIRVTSTEIMNQADYTEKRNQSYSTQRLGIRMIHPEIRKR
jgi:hypothetical protein